MHQTQRIIRVAGPPRSGTNLTKYLIDNYTNVRGVFNLGWWKHALPNPILIKDNKIFQYPTIVMFRETKSQLVSLYKLSCNGAHSLIGDNDPEKFIESPILMKLPDQSLEFFFPSPIDYLIQYYHAMLSWKVQNKFFIQLEDLIDNPQIITRLIEDVFSDCQLISAPTLPSEYLSRNPDKDFSKSVCFDFSTTISSEKNKSEILRSELSFKSKKLETLEKIYEKLTKTKVL